MDKSVFLYNLCSLVINENFVREIEMKVTQQDHSKRRQHLHIIIQKIQTQA